MALAYNLTRLVYVEVERDLEVDFAGGLDALRAPWKSLHALAREGAAEGYKVPEDARPEWAAGGTQRV